MDLILRVLRFLTMGNPDGRQVTIRLIGIAAIVIIVGIWGLNYRIQTPPSGIMGDTSPTLAPLSDAGAISLGGSVTRALPEGERHTWSFDGQAGQRVNIRVRSDWDSTIEVLPPNGSQAIAGDFNSGGGYQAFLCNYPLPTTGTFRAVVSGNLGIPGKNFGDYTLSLEEETYIEERPISYGDTIEGRVTTCDGDFYTVPVEQGDTLQVTLTPESGADLYIRLLPSRTSNDLIAISQSVADADGQSQDVVAINILRDGVVFLQVAAPPTMPDDAAYTLSIGRYEEPTPEATGEATAET